VQDDPEQDHIAKLWKLLRREEKTAKKSGRKGCSKRQEDGGFLSHIKGRMLEEEKVTYLYYGFQECRINPDAGKSLWFSET
jgi:hypothetical protein